MRLSWPSWAVYKQICAINCEQMTPSIRSGYLWKSADWKYANFVLSWFNRCCDIIHVITPFENMFRPWIQRKGVVGKLSFSENAVLPKVLESIYSCGTPRLLLCNILENLKPQGLAWPISFGIETDKIFRICSQKLDSPWSCIRQTALGVRGAKMV